MKALFYGNERRNFANLVRVKEQLEKKGLEVAVSTNNKSLIPELAINKFLLVKPDTYHYDFIIIDDHSSTPLKGKVLTLSEMGEML